MSRKFLIPLLTAVFVAAPTTFVAAQAPSINYNPSKSNTGNLTAHKGIGMTSSGHPHDPPEMAVKNGGVPQNGTTVTGGSGGAERMGGGGGGRTK